MYWVIKLVISSDVGNCLLLCFDDLRLICHNRQSDVDSRSLREKVEGEQIAAAYQRRSNPLATLAIARGGTFQGAEKSSRLL